MTLTLNLRGDLAKLSDAELAARLKETWEQYGAAEKRFHWWQPRWWLLGKRGPIRHPRAYQFLAALQSMGGDEWLSLLFATVLSQRDASRYVRWPDRTAAMHMSVCEIQDIIAEVERRIDQRQATTT